MDENRMISIVNRLKDFLAFIDENGISRAIDEFARHFEFDFGVKEKQIADLEAKLAESEKKVDEFHDKLLDEIQNKVDREVELTNCLNNVVDERDQLKQQLAEKEKEIEELKKGVYKVTLGTTPSNQIDFTENFYVIQNQIAIDELEKVKEFCNKINEINQRNGFQKEPNLENLVTIIERRIKSLKGEK